MHIDNTRTLAAATALEKLLADQNPDPFDGLLRRDDAYTVVLALLRTMGLRRTTVGELHALSRHVPGGHVLGGHDRLMMLLQQAEEHGHIRLDHGQVHIGTAPTGGGAGHVWMRQSNRGGAVVELIGADRWPVGAHAHDETKAWWQCTGCREGLGEQAAMYIYAVRQQVTTHAAKCSYLPPLPDPH